MATAKNENEKKKICKINDVRKGVEKSSGRKEMRKRRG